MQRGLGLLACAQAAAIPSAARHAHCATRSIPIADKMYWTDYGTLKIQRASLDGSNVEDLVTSGLACPGGIALDVAAGR